MSYTAIGQTEKRGEELFTDPPPNGWDESSAAPNGAAEPGVSGRFMFGMAAVVAVGTIALVLWSKRKR